MTTAESLIILSGWAVVAVTGIASVYALYLAWQTMRGNK